MTSPELRNLFETDAQYIDASDIAVAQFETPTPSAGPHRVSLGVQHSHGGRRRALASRYRACTHAPSEPLSADQAWWMALYTPVDTPRPGWHRTDGNPTRREGRLPNCWVIDSLTGGVNQLTSW